MPSSMFAPPAAPDQAGADDDEIAVERSTRAIRIANQFRDAQVPQPAAVSRESARGITAGRPAPAPRPATGAVVARPIRTGVLLIVVIAIAAIGLLVLLLRP